MERLSEFAINHWVLLSVLAGILAGLAYTFVQGARAKAPQVTPLELTALINHDDAQVLDVRDKKSFEKGHILGAHHVALSELPERIVKLHLNPEQPVVVCCDGGISSSSAAITLVKSGFAKVYRLKGGMVDWTQANLPLARD